ncbi:MAG TPA: hypothetical protein VIE43_07200 [Thermoanaerobaculia bacterium]|jgi:hypothetical protein|nr:hypothetical protein [Thermoanaerobaculia bacterium]
MNRAVGKILVGCLFVLTLLSIPAAAFAQLPASPRRFVDNLDVRCYQITGQPPLNLPLRLDHLNPLFVSMKLPFENVVLGSPQQLCVPVEKNGVAPPSDTLPFIQYIDWKCYATTGSPLNIPLTLTQLNPVISSLLGPTVPVSVGAPQQLCVPVVKNNVTPPANVLALVQYLDVKCYGVTTSQSSSATVTLSHLNPLFSALPRENSVIGPQPVQLCVPVTKNQQAVPASVLPYIQYSDVLCYPATGAPLGQNLTLTHLNPLFVSMGLPRENVFVGNSLKLCVPVAKNGMLPPGIQ